jgi:hypothetical protein
MRSGQRRAFAASLLNCLNEGLGKLRDPHGIQKRGLPPRQLSCFARPSPTT